MGGAIHLLPLYAFMICKELYIFVFLHNQGLCKLPETTDVEELKKS
jgi:hypothetical protein